jgi:hypothetical protein
MDYLSYLNYLREQHIRATGPKRYALILAMKGAPVNRRNVRFVADLPALWTRYAWIRDRLLRHGWIFAGLHAIAPGKVFFQFNRAGNTFIVQPILIYGKVDWTPGDLIIHDGFDDSDIPAAYRGR